MPATVTLSSTTIAASVGASDLLVKVASTSGLSVGTRLFCEGELMAVESLEVDPWVKVRRGVDGTAASHHDSTAPVWIGRADQFYSQDPVGAPPEAVLVSPWINVINGTVWFAGGDAHPEGLPYRWWSKQQAAYGQGALGVQTRDLSPTAST